MAADIPYNADPKLVAMKQDFADRKFRVQLIGMAITTGLIVAAVATLFFVPGAISAVGALGSGGGKLLLGGAMAVAGAATSMITMKEVKRLEMDEKFLQSYMQGKNYWGEGYREEVAEHGYSLQAPAFHGAPPPPLAGKTSPQR